MESPATSVVMQASPNQGASPRRQHRRTYNNSNMIYTRNSRLNRPNQDEQNADDVNMEKNVRRNPRVRTFTNNTEIDKKRTVIVTGYPTYTNSQELVRLLRQFGNVELESWNKIVTVVIFETEESAAAAIDSSDQVVVYGKFLKIKRYTNRKHVKDMSRTAKRNNNRQVEDSMIDPKQIDLSGDFYEQIENIQAEIRLTVEEIELIGSLYKDVETALQTTYPGCRAIPFGSITTGLGIKGSDADCFVEMPARFIKEGHDVRFVQVARRLLASKPELFSEVIAIPGANTPIVKFKHVPTGTRCDLNCKTPLGALNSRLIAALLAHDNRLASAALTLKFWARTHHLSGSGRLTNYALVLLLLFYLQARRILPPIASIQGGDFVRPVDAWDAGFAPDRIPPPADDSPLPHLLGGFFEFYEKFNFDALVVCPYLGCAVPKEAFEGNMAPQGLERYATAVQERRVAPLRHASYLVVQDPIEQSHNVTTGVSRSLAIELKQYICFAAEKYRASLPTCRDFVSGILLSCPEKPPKRAPAVRVRIAPRELRAVAGDWKPKIRDLLINDIFETLLALSMEPVTEKGQSGDRYKASTNWMTWQRRKLANSTVIKAADLLERETAVTDQLLKDPSLKLTEQLEIDVRLVWGSSRSLSLIVQMVNGQQHPYKLLAGFLHTILANWVHVLIQPLLIPPPAPSDAATSAPPVSELESLNLDVPAAAV